MSISEKYIAELYNKIQEERPIIHCITNAVTVNDCANILLAAGASPTMAHHPLEVEEITAGTKALVCNFGAIADYEAMEKAGRVADELGHAIVIDPVGVSGSSYRREKCQTLIENIHPTCIRGNYSEIRALMEHCSTATGVDSGDKNLDIEAMKQYAKQYHLIMIASGEKILSQMEPPFIFVKMGMPKWQRSQAADVCLRLCSGLFWEQCLPCRVQQPVVRLLELQENLHRKNRCMWRWNHDVP